jgi:hypothetical protein
MASITSTPATLQGCYKALIYTYTHTITSNANVMSIEVEIYVNAVLVATKFINAFKSVSESGGDYTYTYDIDISKTVQDFFDNKAVFYPQIASYPKTDVGFLAKNTAIKIFRYEPNSSGILTKNGTSTDSATRTYFNSLINSMSDYTAVTGRKFLSSEPNEVYFLNTVKTLAVYGDSRSTHLEWKRDGSLVTRFTITANQINIIDLSDYTAVAGEKISFRVGIVNPETDGFVANSETKSYLIKDLYCNSITLHYQNEFGQMDSFVFSRFTKQVARENEFFTNSNYANTILNQEVRYNYTLIQDGFNIVRWNWFNNFINSTVFYIEIDSVFKEVTISNLTNFETISEDGNIDISIRLTESLETDSFTN